MDAHATAEAIARRFRERQPTDILPPELIPGDLDEAYRVRHAFEAIENPGVPFCRKLRLGGCARSSGLPAGRSY